MSTPRPVSMQRIRGAFDSLHIPLQEVSSGLWQQVNPGYVINGTVEGGNILCFKAVSTRCFTTREELIELGHFITTSNRGKAFPKSYMEPLVVAGDYTLGAETSRRVSSGLSEAQFNDFLEHAFLVLTAFFQEFEASALAKTAAVNNG